jgi:hypothetical protein
LLQNASVITVKGFKDWLENIARVRRFNKLRTYPGIRPGWTGMRLRQIITAQANSTRAR